MIEHLKSVPVNIDYFAGTIMANLVSTKSMTDMDRPPFLGLPIHDFPKAL